MVSTIVIVAGKKLTEDGQFMFVRLLASNVKTKYKGDIDPTNNFSR